MPRHLLRAAALAAALLPAAWAAAAPLSLDQALDLALQASPMVRAARAGAAGAAERARAAGQQPDPMLSAGIDNLPVTGPQRFSTGAEDMTMKRIGLAQEWVPVGKRAARQALAAAVQQKEALMVQTVAAETRLQAATAYVDAYFASEALVLATANERHAREALEAGRGRLAAAAGGSAELLGLAGALGAAEDESAEQRQQQASALAALQRWIGQPADALDAPRLAAPPNAAHFIAQHPAVVVKQRDVEVARQEVELMRLNRRPNITYELSYGQRQGRPDLVSLGISIPLPVAPAVRQDRETAASLALADKAQAELADAERAAAGEYAAWSSEARRLQQRIDHYQQAALAPLQQRTEATLAAYRANQASLPMLFEARHAELEAQRKLLALRRDLARAQVQLAFKPVHAEGATP